MESRPQSIQEKEEVRDFLQLVKEAIANPVADKGWVLVPRKENRECLLQLGFKYSDIQGTILGLSVEDYCEGPCRDRDQLGELWVFGKVIESKTIYIKLKLASFDRLKIVRVVSFHFAEQMLEHPFKARREQRL